MEKHEEYRKQIEEKIGLLRELAREGSPIEVKNHLEQYKELRQCLQTYLKFYEKNMPEEFPVPELTKGQERRLVMKAHRRKARKKLTDAQKWLEKGYTHEIRDIITDSEKSLEESRINWYGNLMSLRLAKKIKKNKPILYSKAMNNETIKAFSCAYHRKYDFSKSHINCAIEYAKDLGYNNEQIKKMLDYMNSEFYRSWRRGSDKDFSNVIKEIAKKY